MKVISLTKIVLEYNTPINSYAQLWGNGGYVPSGVRIETYSLFLDKIISFSTAKDIEINQLPPLKNCEILIHGNQVIQVTDTFQEIEQKISTIDSVNSPDDFIELTNYLEQTEKMLCNPKAITFIVQHENWTSIKIDGITMSIVETYDEIKQNIKKIKAVNEILQRSMEQIF